MENNETISSATSVASKGTDKAEQNDHSLSLPDKPSDATLPQTSIAVSYEDPVAAKEDSPRAKDSSEAQPGSRDPSEAKPAGRTSTGAQSYVPPVKRFSAVNINKKFLQKNQTSAIASSGASSGSSSSKQPGALARPSPQTAHSHSRLVTAKLTASPLSSSPGQGWSRPSSVTPPAPSPANASGPAKGPTPAIAPAVGHGPLHIAPSGKIIQLQALKQKGDGPGRPAWRSVQLGTTASALQAQKEFPTAAEAAQSHLAKLSESKALSDSSDAHKQAMSESADAFRGVHLDPNAHHWDEMEEEDNDDFLGDVIEFGDGRQYTIHVSEEAQAEVKGLDGNLAPEVPVSKEERFVDDFDRSWPKSRQEYGRDELVQHGRSSRSETSSNFSGHSPVSLRDGTQSRLLFNERSNRMEPFSGARPGPGSYGPPRGGAMHRDRPDVPGRFHGGRLERDAPPHSAFRRPHESPWGHPHGTEQHARDLRELRAELPSSNLHGEHHDRKGRSEWPSGRSRDGPSPNGRAFGSRERSASRSINGAPSIASSDGHSSRYASSIRDHQKSSFLPGHSRDLDRHLPPHLAQPQSERTSADGDPGAHSRPAFEGASVKDQDKPEFRPFSSAQPQLDADTVKALASVPQDDPEAIRKAYLHERAERAKIRRQQEEEERMKAQERARKKATELEAKIAATKATEAVKDEPQSIMAPQIAGTVSVSDTDKQKPTEAEVLRVIEGAVGSAVSSGAPSDGKPSESRRKEPDGQKSSFAKALSRGESDRSVPPREGQEPGQPKRPPTSTKADQAESWRAKPKPPMLPVENSKNDISQEPVVSVLPDVRAFDIQADESTEVVDFNEMSRLISENDQKSSSDADLTVAKPDRLVANDPFKGPASQKSDKDTWRKGDSASRRPYPGAAEDGFNDASYQKPAADASGDRADPHVSGESGMQHVHLQLHSKAQANANGSTVSPGPNSYQHSVPGASKFLRSPNQPYREAPLSALDDTMSRIKGALDVMHSVHDHGTREPTGPPAVRLPAPTSVPPKSIKWLPPALRPAGMTSSLKRTDAFEPTHPEPPRSPAPPVARAPIRLPTVSRRIEPLSKRQINYQKYFVPVRWDILSFVPPVEGMSKRSLSVNDVLFKKPQGPFKTRKYRVQLPRSRAASSQSSGERPHGIDDSSLLSTGASQSTTNGSIEERKSSWRSTFASTMVETEGTSEDGLDITSRSPPPELVTEAERIPISGVTSKPRASQKSLDVTDVAFYRDVRRQADGNAPAVTFTVSSELESQSDGSPLRKTPILSSDISKPSPITNSESSTSLPLQSSSVKPSLAPTKELSSPLIAPTQPETQVGTSKVFDRQVDPFSQRQPVTPPPQNSSSSWAKSPARVPDPEHLKAVWSQAPDDDSIPAINSLKNIADDLTSLPFTLQEVKSEGGTPPPAPPGPVAPPTRMSASEVTRAFQTVPAGPSNGVGSAGLRSNQIPSSLGSPIGAQRALKPPAIGLPPPPSVNSNAPRPPYMGYPPSTSNHSPSPPTLVYSHVIPNGMGASPAGSPYGQPVWMSLVQQGQQMLRPQSSAPYSPSLMPYSMPGAQNGMYPPNNMQNPQGSPAAYHPAPLPSQMMVSPVMAHATAVPPAGMYPGSPMLMHVPPPGTPQTRPSYPPGPVGMGRGSLPVANPMDPRSQPHPPAAPASRFSVHNPGPGYTPVPPPPSYARPW